MNSNLTPEKRMDKNGRLVTKHVNNGGRNSSSKKLSNLLSSILPAGATGDTSSPHKAALNALITQGYEDICESVHEDYRRREEGSTGDSDALQRRRDSQLKRALLQKNHILDVAKDYSEETSRLISNSSARHNLAAREIFHLMNRDDSNELELRECFSYAGALQGKNPPVLMKHVRESLGVDDTSNQPNSQGISAVYAVALEARQKRYDKYWEKARYTDDDVDTYHEFESTGKLASTRRQMTPELAQVILDHHERASEITQYLGERHNNVIETLDAESLREYLETPARALTKGML